jgi:hypothetical protein
LCTGPWDTVRLTLFVLEWMHWWVFETSSETRCLILVP